MPQNLEPRAVYVGQYGRFGGFLGFFFITRLRCEQLVSAGSQRLDLFEQSRVKHGARCVVVREIDGGLPYDISLPNTLVFGVRIEMSLGASLGCLRHIRLRDPGERIPEVR